MSTKFSSSFWSILTLLSMLDQVAVAQELPADQADAIVQACAQIAEVKLSDDLAKSILDTYSDVETRSDFSSVGPFLARMPPPERGVALKLFDCLSKNLLLATPQPQPKPEPPQPVLPTVTYKVCSGEYESRCQQHDVYLYCYSDVGAWASARCNSSTVNRYNTYGGNKCGYSMDLVTCTGPK
ncbi:hypothetical protein NKH54_08530 [Mesorhizobium sp. M1004]|uniref:hypothetical protein n=1 Tax=Mesorhizobium sp. M1004 TaxID=2957046 RepID=UPI00333B8DC3